MDYKFLKNINELIEKEQEERIAKGEDFNLVEIMSMEYNETKTHSSIIASLLNPKGKHYQGELFLKLFIDKLEKVAENEWVNFKNLKNTEVIKEFNTGKVDLEKVTGGFIDIFIKLDDGSIISIENKIYAGDQPLQLERYKNYKSSINTVFYLTLDGKEYQSKNLKNDEHYYCISYKEHIKEWLEECLENLEKNKKSEQTLLKSSIKQYLILIKKITGQMENKSNKELKENIIKNMEASQMIADNIENVKNELLLNFKNKLVEKLSALKDVEIVNNEKKGSMVCLYLPNHKVSKNVSIAIYPFKTGENSFNQNKIVYGIRVKDGNQDVLKKIFGNEHKDTSWWPLYYHIDELNLNNPQTFINLSNPVFVKEQVVELKNKIENFITENSEKLNNVD